MDLETIQEMKRTDKDAGYYLSRMNERTNKYYEIEMSKTKRITWPWDNKFDLDD